MSVATVAAFLVGMLVGVCLVFIATGMILASSEWRSAWREGDELRGDEMERNRKREES